MLEHLKRKERDSPSASLETGHNRSSSDSSDDETLLGSPSRSPKSVSPASPISAKEEMTSSSHSSSSELTAPELFVERLVVDVNTKKFNHDTEKTIITEKEADHVSEIENLRLVYAQAINEMKEKLDQKDEAVKNANYFAAAAANKLAVVLTKRSNAGASSTTIQQLTMRRDNLLQELETNRGKISDLTRSVRETKEELVVAVMRNDDTRTALAAAKAEATAAKAKAAEMEEFASRSSNISKEAVKELTCSNDKIDALLHQRGHEVIKQQIGLITFLRAENEDLEQQLHASSLENSNLRECTKATADEVAENRQLVSSYKKELQSCNAKILDFENALQAETGSDNIANLIQDREKTMAELTARVEEVAYLHQMEGKYEKHVMEMRTEVQYQYQANDSLEQEISKMKEDIKRVHRANARLEQKITFFESNKLLVSRYDNICNNHAILKIVKKEKLTLEKDIASLATLEQKNKGLVRLEEDLKVLIHDMLLQIIKLSHALELRGAFPFNRAYEGIIDRVSFVAQIEAEDVYAEATTDGCEHAFDVQEMVQGDEEDAYDEDEEDSYDERETSDDGSTPGEGRADSNGGSQAYDSAGIKTVGKDMGLKTTSSSISGSGEKPSSTGPNSLAEEVEILIAAAAEQEDVPVSAETLEAKARSVLDPPKGHSVAIPPMVDGTPDNHATEHLLVRDLENTYVDDVEYSSKYENVVDGSDSSDGENVEEEKELGVGKEPEHIGGVDSSKVSKSEISESSQPSLFATPKADTEGNWTDESVPSEPLMTSKTAEEASFSWTGKGNSRDIWQGTSFATANNDLFSQAALAADLKLGTEEKPQFFMSFMEQKPAETKTPTSENHTKARKETAYCTIRETSFPTQINFAGESVPGLFTGSSSSFPGPATQPASARIFSFQEHSSPSVTVPAKDKAGEAVVAKVESLKEDVPEIDALKETSSGEKATNEDLRKIDTPERESLPEKFPVGEIQKEQLQKANNAPKEEGAPTTSEPSRKERKAAKKAQEKAAQKAMNEARNMKVQESRRIEKAMMMK